MEFSVIWGLRYEQLVRQNEKKVNGFWSFDAREKCWRLNGTDRQTAGEERFT